MSKYKAIVRDTEGNNKEMFVEGEDTLAIGRMIRSRGLTLIDLVEIEYAATPTNQSNPFDSTRNLETDFAHTPESQAQTLEADPQVDPALIREKVPKEPPRMSSAPSGLPQAHPYAQNPQANPSAAPSPTKGKYTPPAIYEAGPRVINTLPFTSREVDPDDEPTEDGQKQFHTGRALEIDYQSTPRGKSGYLQQDVVEGIYYTGTISTWDKTAALMLPVATLNDLVFFTRQMAQMLRAGLTVDLALASFLGMNISPYIKGICNLLHRDVTNGNTLANSMRKHPRLFSNHFIGMVRVAEIGGRLDSTFDLLALYFEKEREFRQRIMSALMQPGCVFIALLIATGFFSFAPLVAMFNPFFKPVFFGLLIFLGAMIGVMILMSFKHIGGFIRIFMSMLPGIGPYLRKVALSRISFSIANLLKAGVNVLEAVSMTAPSAFLPQFERELRLVEQRLHQGITLHSAMKMGWLFPPVVKNMIAVGEATGETDVMMMKIHQYYEEDIAYLQRNFAAVIGPITIVIVGVILLFVLLQFWSGYGAFIDKLVNENFFYFGP